VARGVDEVEVHCEEYLYSRSVPLLATFAGTSVIMAEMSVTQTHKTGKEFKYDAIEVYHIRRGKMVRMTHYFSAPGLAEVEAARKIGGKA
jgi:ketosteroid isomerase-like protein